MFLSGIHCLSFRSHMMYLSTSVNAPSNSDLESCMMKRAPSDFASERSVWRPKIIYLLAIVSVKTRRALDRCMRDSHVSRLEVLSHLSAFDT